MIMIDMNMPDVCRKCFCSRHEDGNGSWCVLDEETRDLTYADLYMKKPEWCPVHELKNPAKPEDDFETAYFAGYEYGYQMAVKDVIKHLKGMKWYGGDKQNQRTAGMPEHYEGGTADMQQKLERPGTKGRHGRSMAAGTEKD